MPSSRLTGSPSRIAFRSHSAVSTAEMAQDTSPGRPMFRVARTIACHEAAVSSTFMPWIAAASGPSISGWHAAAAYVYPVPVRPPPVTWATTRVVDDQASVPSASGWSVGIS